MEEYAQTLQGAAAIRYVAKLQLVSGVDPYKLKFSEWDTNPKSLPSVEYLDIVNYCVYTKSAYTMNELKSYKSLDAYYQFVSGWVFDLASYVVNNRVIVKAKVRHSQSISRPPLQPWIIAEKSGNILAAHCNCMAGLAETCTHVSATLFAIDASVRLEKSRTVTEEAAYWMLPSNVKKVTYSRLKDIDFTSATTMKKNLDNKLSQTPIRQYYLQPLPFVEPPNTTEMNNLFQKLHDTGAKPSILSIVPNFVESYVPRLLSSLYPWVSVELRKDRGTSATLEDIDELCTQILTSNTLLTTKEACQLVEEQTRSQAASHMWFRFRAGRITSSNMKKACITSPLKPSISTVKSICYPSLLKFKTAATDWGCQHESGALDCYTNLIKDKHTELKISKSGLHIDHNNSYLGATPDSLVSCNCCGKGVLEIKCPFCLRDIDIQGCVDKRSSLENVYGKLHLKNLMHIITRFKHKCLCAK
ncbi:uncharacterized protein LOC136079507 [Hydra vulgaris]|uniref:Uncharacterized protein LOC136079507 n=1 Tax=Hydra vulgaris TaxID=6087 RepID=A0ABM4BQ96_HYDVU